MKLFIANTTKQDHEFHYRINRPSQDLPDSMNPRIQQIPAGGQVQLPGDFNLETIKYIIEQKAPYGMVDARELPRTNGFVGLCYSTEKPVSMDALLGTYERNDHELNAAADDRRAEAAAAIAGRMSKELGVQVQRAEVEQVEAGDVQGPVRDLAAPKVAVGAEVLADNVAPRHKGQQERRAREAAR